MGSQPAVSMSIGEFGRLTGLSIKALRLYDVSGLLPPAEVDDLSGYRRYTAGQLDRARRIGVLRRLGAPLAVIGEMLALPDAEAVTRLDRWWAGEDAATAARRSGYLWLRTALAHGDEPEKPYSVRVERRPERKVATIRTVVDQQALVPAIGAAQWAIRAHLDEQGATHGPEHWVIYHGVVTPDTAATVEVCVPCSGVVEPIRDITLRREPEHLVALATVLRDGRRTAALGHLRAGHPVREPALGRPARRSAGRPRAPGRDRRVAGRRGRR
ncbi:MerR family transcriptional regulator [Actinoplanes palleronii]|uniref:MerR family transcriptional regulator n=1 Tax=Actinoplanes palleronii TaxID=113570 RepID=A0ABQ4B4R3_9ACTN|nr:MerR family transcriptional regulator [Actinoplanes palleronii]GIE65640.1 MerR family transcriptional regulator [Actinoplanes palleronii]